MATIKETLIDLFDLDKMEPEKAAEMVDRLAKLVFQSVLVRVLPMMSEQDLEEYEKIIDGEEGADVLMKFLNDKVPNFGKILEEEAELLRKEISGEFKDMGLE